MKIKPFYDEGLAQLSYAIFSQGEIALIDPARDPRPYYAYAREQEGSIKAVIETHPHADFISSHLEIHQHTAAPVYTSRLSQAAYPHQAFDSGDSFILGLLTLKAVNTPGHSPDSISVVLVDEDGREYAIFSGDTLFVGDVGRPDLREEGGAIDSRKESLAKQLYRSTRQVFMQFERETMLYPGHGAGSLCGKTMSQEHVSTIGRELEDNAMLREMDEEAFVEALLKDQPFIPKYFKHSVELNKRGAPGFQASLSQVAHLTADEKLGKGVLVIDAREQNKFKNAHIPGALNLMNGPKFETWLGSIVGPDEEFYLIAADQELLDLLIAKTAKIGYEGNIRGAMVCQQLGEKKSRYVNLEHVRANPEAYTIIDIRNQSELSQGGKLFAHARHIPLHQLRERAAEIPTDMPLLVHCGAGYRSAIGFSILEKELPEAQIYDLSSGVKEFI